MAALSSDARRRSAAMLWPRQTSSSCSFGDAPVVTGGVAALEHGIWGGGDPPVPPAPPPPPLLQYVIIVSPANKGALEFEEFAEIVDKSQ